MTLIYVLLGLAILVGLFDLWLRYVYRYPKRRHRTTPEELGIPFREVRFPTRRGRQLYGWWVPAQEKPSGPAPTLILVHGWARNVESVLPLIKGLHPLGYNLLAFDLRNHGSSDPDKYPNLLKFSEDIRAAVDFLIGNLLSEPSPIGIIGLSVGGGAAIHAAAFDIRISSVVTIGALASPVDVMRLEFQKRHIPFYPLGWLSIKYLQFKLGLNFEEIAPVNNIGKVRAKILLIHGENDAVIPVEQGKRLQIAGNPDRTLLWIVPEKNHTDCVEHPEFRAKVEAFLQETIPVKIASAASSRSR